MRLSFSSLSLATALLVSTPAFAEDAAAPAADAVAPAEATKPAEAPQLILAISVDQFSADLFAQYREHFSKGFARLLDGAVFPSGYRRNRDLPRPLYSADRSPSRAHRDHCQ